MARSFARRSLRQCCENERRVRAVHLVQVDNLEPLIMAALGANRGNDFLEKVSQCFSVLRITTNAENTFTECKAGVRSRKPQPVVIRRTAGLEQAVPPY